LNKILSIKSNAIFLAAVLVVGTFAAISPSFIIGVNAQYEPKYGMDTEYNSYKPSYENDIYDAPPSYGIDNYHPREYPSYQQDYKQEYPKYVKDTNGYKSKKDSNSKSVSINKINCINNNVNINGDNTGNISIGNKGQGYSGGYSSTGSGSGYGSGEGYDGKQGKGIDCIINNNNTNNNIAGGGNQTTTKATLNVSKIVTCTYRVGGLAPETACAMLEERITENQFLIEVIDDNPIPSQFPGSESGTIVTLGAGNYIVSETPDVASIQSDIDFLENEFEDLAGGGTEYEITGPFPSFTGDCTDVNPNIPQSTEATGTIAAGESQTCNVINHFTITALQGPVGEP
jgi:hypothetical protein